MKKIYSTALLLFISISLFSQTNFTCTFDSAFEHRKRLNPEAQQELEQFMKTSVRESNSIVSGKIYHNSNKRAQSPDMAHYVIPIAVHIIHKTADASPGTGSNISDAQVNNQIEVLNNCFKPYGIQFCLATKNIDSSTFSGITRRADVLTNYRENLDEVELMKLDLFPRDKYLNIWVVNRILDDNGNDKNQVGAGSFPDSRKHGIVMRADFFGDSVTCSTCNLHYQSRGKALVHEMGHLLGLLHTHEGGCQGTDSSDCSSGGDFICDTPPMQFIDFNCVDTNTCFETPTDFKDPITNYMSYKHQTCMDTFSPGQVKVMYYHIEKYFETNINIENIKYLTSNWCNKVTALFKSEMYQSCNPTTIKLTALDSNINRSYRWKIKNTSLNDSVIIFTSTNSLNHNFNNYGIYDVELSVMDGSYNISRTQKSMIRLIDCGNVIPSTIGNWYFGEYAGLEFRANAAVSNDNSYFGGIKKIPKSNLNSLEGCVVQNNDKGELLFYGGGKASYNIYGNVYSDDFFVYDKKHNLMPHGVLYGTTTSLSGGISVPMPGDKSKYYLFTFSGERFHTDISFDKKGLRYSIIDTTLNGGNGDVDTFNMNVPIKTPSNRYVSTSDSAIITGEGITAIPGCDSTFYYLIVTSFRSPTPNISKDIEIYKVTSNGVNHHSQHSLADSFWGMGSIDASPDGHFVSVCGILFEFDREFGTLKLIKNLQERDSTGKPDYGLYRAQFSPNSKILYIVRKKNIDYGEYESELRQYDLTTGLNEPSKTILKQDAHSIQNGPDGKMYIAQSNDNFISYIDSPNNVNDYTNINKFHLQNDKINLKMGPANMKSMQGLPNFMDAIDFINVQKNIHYRIVNCKEVSFSTNHTCGNSYIWDFGDGNSDTGRFTEHNYSGKLDSFYVTLTVDGITTYYDTIRFGFEGTKISGKNTTCDTANKSIFFLSPAKSHLYKYQWSVSNGNIVSNPTNNYSEIKWSQDSGTIQVVATDKYGCMDTASMNFHFSNLIQNNSLTYTNSCDLDSIGSSFPTGGTGNFKYNWRAKKENGYWFVLDDTSKSIVPISSKIKMYYQRIVKSGACESYSNVVVVSSLENENKIEITYPTTDVDYCYPKIKGTKFKELYPTASFYWQRSTDLSTWTTFFTLDDTLTNTIVTNIPPYYYRRMLVSNTCTSYSNVIMEPQIIIKQPEMGHYCGELNFPLTFKYKVANNYIVYWQYKHIGLDDRYWASYDNGRSSTDTIIEMYQKSDSIKVTDSIRFIVNRIGCSDHTYISNYIIPSPIDSLEILTHPKDTTVDNGLSFQFAIEVNNPSVCDFKWQYSFDGTSDWNDIDNSNNINYTSTANSNCYDSLFYRVKIIHPCTTSYSNSAKLIVNSGGPILHDFWIKDQYSDNGNEWNLDSNVFNSPDIWVRTKKDGNRVHQNVTCDLDTNWVYVNIRNRGTGTTDKAKLYVYWTWSSTYEHWNRSWTYNTGNYINGFPTGGEINSIPIDIPEIAPLDSVTIAVPWTKMPQQNWYNLRPKPWNNGLLHVCFLARIETCPISQYGMTYKEKTDILYNVVYNNNIATKNSGFVYLSDINQDKDNTQGQGSGRGQRVLLDRPDIIEGGVIRIENNQEVPSNIKLCVSLKDASYLTKADAYIQFGPDLYQAWLNGGSQSTGLIQVEEDIYKITGTNACITGAYVDSGFSDGIRMFFGYKDVNSRFPDAGQYRFSLRQYDSFDKFLGECWITVKDNPFLPTDTAINNTSIYVCDWENAGVSSLYTVDEPTWNHTIYNKSTSSFVSIDGNGTYNLSEGDYEIFCNSIYNVKKTNLTIGSTGITEINLEDTVEYNCDSSSTIPYTPSCSGGIMYDQFNSVLNPSSGNLYYLDASNGFYTYECADTPNCTRYTTQINFKDIIEVPTFNSNYITGSYDRSDHPCCFVDLSEVTCDGETPLSMGQYVEIYDMTPSLLYSTNLEFMNGMTLGFRFCPPQWDTNSSNISNWYSIVLRNDECSFCRMDFKCDSLSDPEPFVIVENNQPKDKQNNFLNENVKNIDLQGKNNSESENYFISIFPNPAYSEINIKAHGVGSKSVEIRISDAAGKSILVNQYDIDNSNLNTKIALTELSSGVYTIYIPELNFYYKLVVIK
jgi:hypothetical protein